MGTKKGQHGSSVSTKRGALHKQSDDLRQGEIYRMAQWNVSQVVRFQGKCPRVLRPSFEGMMANGRDCYNPMLDSRAKAAWREKHVTVVGWTSHGYRVFALVHVMVYDMTMTFLMDAKTGTFYRVDTGECCSSDNEKVEHIMLVDDIKPYLRATSSVAHVGSQWGNERYGRHYG